MPKLLVEFPDGNQQFLDIDDTGSFFDPSKVIWDERIDGEIPEGLVLGKIIKINNTLQNGEDYIPDYLVIKQAKDQENILQQNFALWTAADSYINAEINGVGLSMLSTGVNQQKPKAIAVAKWTDSIWTEYYLRKATITADTQVNLDFSMFGAKPYTVLELREEIAELWEG